ncbi:MAG TPA: serine hydrolase domain-containing protein [Cyclobacteriaceae bacterium]|nr:serine hydrolase domain-containing protein [Cyclobacteriaceae bacterium]
MRPLLTLLIIAFTFIGSSGQKKGLVGTLAELTDSIQTILDKDHVVGVMLGIASKDSVIFTGGFGYADLENKITVDEHTLFRMGSITKMFVSLGISRLVEQGRLSLNDELKIVAPEVHFQNKWEATHPVRIIHLLEHTSGFDDIKLNAMYSLSPLENHGREMMLVHRNSLVCRWRPGERTAYSNPNYTILGYIIEKLSGMTYDQYLSDIILNPLQMKESNFNVRSKTSDNVQEYIFDNGKIKHVPSVVLLGGPQGSLWSSSHDMVRFLQLFLRDGAPLFTAQTISDMETAHSSLGARSGLKLGYGLGNSIAFLNAKYPFQGHRGMVGTCHSGLYYNRELNIGFVIASNSDYNNFKIENLVLSFLLRQAPERKQISQALDEGEMKPFLGAYQFESPRNEIAAILDKIGNLQRIYIENGDLYSQPLFGRATKLVQTSARTFRWPDANTPMIVFTRNEGGKAVMCIGGTYYEKVSYSWAIAKKVAVLVAILLALSSLVYAIISTIGAISGKVKWTELIFRFTPMIALIVLMLAVTKLLQVQEHTYLLYELNTVNARTLTIFVGTTLFGVLSLVNLVFVIREFKKIRSRWFAWYLLLMGLSFACITLLLLDAGWIGLRTWAM